MPKGESHRRDEKKKPSMTLKEKRQKKRDKKFRIQPEHTIDQPLE